MFYDCGFGKGSPKPARTFLAGLGHQKGPIDFDPVQHANLCSTYNATFADRVQRDFVGLRKESSAD